MRLTRLGGKQAALTFDNAPTSGSNNPVKSGRSGGGACKKPYVMTGTGAPLTTLRMPDGSMPPKGTIYYDTTAEYLVPYVANITGEGVAAQLKMECSASNDKPRNIDYRQFV